MWTRVKTSVLSNIAYDRMRTNYLPYHNVQHIEYMYNFLESSGVEYDEALDWAVLFHDVIYDSKKNKESRSAQFFYENAMTSGLDAKLIRRAANMIIATNDHIVTFQDELDIIRADLAALCDPVQTIINFRNILQENQQLYPELSVIDICDASQEFMNGLRKRLVHNKNYDDEFFTNAMKGIDITINLSELVKDAAKDEKISMNTETLAKLIQAAILDGQLRALERVTDGQYPTKSIDSIGELITRSKKIAGDFHKLGD